MERHAEKRGGPICPPGLVVLWAGLAASCVFLLLWVMQVPPALAGRGPGLMPRPALFWQPRRDAPPHSPDDWLPAGADNHRIVATIPLTPGIGQEPVAIAADPHSPLVYVANEGSGDITVLSGTQVLGMVAAVHEGDGADPTMRIGVHPSTGLLYAMEETAARCAEPARSFQMQLISATQVITTVSLGGCAAERGGCEVTAMAFQPANGYLYLLRAYSSNPLPIRGDITILEGTRVVGDIALEGITPRFVATDAQQGWIYVTADYTDVFVLHDTDIVGRVPVNHPGQVEVQPSTGLAYVLSDQGHLIVLSGTANLGEVAVGQVADMAADPISGYLYVSHPATPTVTVVSGTTVLTEVASINPGGILEVNLATHLIYLRNPNAPFVTVLSGTAVLTQVAVLGGNAAIASNPVTGLVYAVDGTNSVAVLQGTQRLTTLPPAFPQPRAMEADPLTGQVILLSSPPALSFIAGESIIATVPLTATPEQMLVHPTSGLVYLTMPEEEAVLVMSGTKLLATVPLDGRPTDIAVQPRTGLVYVAGNPGALNVLSGTVRIATLLLNTESWPHVAVDPGRGFVYVTDPWGNAVYILTGTEVLTDVPIYSPNEVAVEPRSGYAYVGGTGYDGLWVISATTVITSIDLHDWNVLDIRPSLATGYLYLDIAPGWPTHDRCARIGVIRRFGWVSSWFSAEEIRLSSLETHPSLSYVYAGHATYGSRLSIGVGSRLVQTLSVGDGSWVRAIAVAPGADRVYVATDHAIAILEANLPYLFYMPLVVTGQRSAE